MQNMTLIDFDIFYQMSPLRKLHNVTVSYIFKEKKLKRKYFEKWWVESKAKLQNTTFIDFDICDINLYFQD